MTHTDRHFHLSIFKSPAQRCHLRLLTARMPPGIQNALGSWHGAALRSRCHTALWSFPRRQCCQNKADESHAITFGHTMTPFRRAWFANTATYPRNIQIGMSASSILMSFPSARTIRVGRRVIKLTSHSCSKRQSHSAADCPGGLDSGCRHTTRHTSMTAPYSGFAMPPQTQPQNIRPKHTHRGMLARTHDTLPSPSSFHAMDKNHKPHATIAPTTLQNPVRRTIDLQKLYRVHVFDPNFLLIWEVTVHGRQSHQTRHVSCHRGTPRSSASTTVHSLVRPPCFPSSESRTRAPTFAG